MPELFGWWLKKQPTKKPLTVSDARDMVQAAFYSAASESESMDFSFAPGVGLNQALLTDLNKLRNRCRYELRNNPVAKGMPRVFANSVIGTGPRLSIQSESREWSRDCELAWSIYEKSCDYMDGGSLGSMLHLGVRQFFPVGEYIHVSRRAEYGNIRTKWLAIRPDRVGTPYNYQGAGVIEDGHEISNGVEVDRDGRPVAYWILRVDPDNNPYTLYTYDDYERVSARNVIHVFYRDDPIQHRGEPWFAASLPTWHKLRRYDEATIAAATVAAKFAAVLVNTNPDLVADASLILPETVLDIQDGQMLIPPPGYEPKQITPQHPSTNASDFRRDQISAAGAANAMPANIANQNSNEGSFASARFDGVGLTQDGEVIRKIIEGRDLNRRFRRFMREAVAVGILPEAPMDYRTVWLWPKEDRHTDPLKQQNANRVAVETGLSTVGHVQMQNGLDQETAYDQLRAEVDRWRADGLRHPIDAGAPSAQQTEEADDAEAE